MSLLQQVRVKYNNWKYKKNLFNFVRLLLLVYCYIIRNFFLYIFRGLL